MDQRLKTIKQTFSGERLSGMSFEQLVLLVGKAGPNATFHGTAVVRKADGLIRYDKNAKPGDYHETQTDLDGLHAIKGEQ